MTEVDALGFGAGRRAGHDAAPDLAGDLGVAGTGDGKYQCTTGAQPGCLVATA
jgi:hypothetical protein